MNLSGDSLEHPFMSAPIYTLYDVLTINNGNVGIGTSEPQRGFHIEGAIMTKAISSPSGIVDMTNTTLSNITSITVQQLSIGQTMFTSQGSAFSNISACNILVDKISPYVSSYVDFAGSTLSNIGAIRVAQILSDAANINVNTRTLSNISALSTSAITSDASNINVSAKSLSNIVNVVTTNLVAGTASLSNITSDAANINVSAKSLSNVTTLSLASLTSDAANINVSAKSLSNIINVVSTNLVAGTASLSNITSDAANININGKTLSNLSSLVSQTILTSSVSLSNITSDAANINVNAKTLSNINTISIANVTSDAANINVNAKSLSNVTALSVASLTSDATNINVSAKSLSNIVNVVTTNLVAGTASLSNITSDAANINVSGKSLSNIVNVVSTNVVTGTASLSNITSDAANINVSGKTLSNVATLSVSKIRTDAANIDFSSSALVGISSINASGDATFGGTVYASNLNIIGQFMTMNTITSNTEQFVVTNAGTGPALKVIQTGVGSQYAVAEFIDNETGMALRIQDTGLVGIGTNSVQSRLGVNGGVAIGSYVNVAAPTNGIIVSGNVGIGSSAPVGALDVGGVITGRDLITQDVNSTRYIQSMSRTSFVTTGNKFVGFTITWANTTSDQKLSFKVNIKAHFTSDTNTTYSSVEAVITPVDANPKPNGLLIGTPLTTAQNTNNFRNISLTATRNAANAVDLKLNFQANLTPSEAFVYIDILAPTALGTFTLTPISG